MRRMIKMGKEKLSFDELNELYKKDVDAYRKYIDECSWDELINYAMKV